MKLGIHFTLADGHKPTNNPNNTISISIAIIALYARIGRMQLLSIVQLGLAILLTALVLIQRANTDASGAFGADGGTGFSVEKRGAEKSLHSLTIVIAILFSCTLALPIILN